MFRDNMVRGKDSFRPHILLVVEEAGGTCAIKSRSVSSGRHLQRLDMALLRYGVSISLVLMLCAHFFLSSAGKWRASWWSEFLLCLLLPFPLPLLLLLLLLLLLVLLLAILPSLTPLSPPSLPSLQQTSLVRGSADREKRRREGTLAPQPHVSCRL